MRKMVFIIFIIVISSLPNVSLIGLNGDKDMVAAVSRSDMRERSCGAAHIHEEKFTKSTDPWVDPTYKYRRRISITETSGSGIIDLPVEFYVRFDPPAYFESQTSHSIRVVDYSGSEIPIQIYNITWYDYSSNLIGSATVAMYVDLSAGSTATYYIYWTDEATSSVNYQYAVNFVQTSTGYIFSTDMYEVETKNSFGGKIYRVSLNGIDVIHSSQDEYMDKSAHFSPVYVKGVVVPN